MPTPPNALSDKERDEIVKVCADPEYSSLPPSQIVPALADKGIYLASESTFYRVLHDAGLNKRRSRVALPRKRSKPNHVATGPREVWVTDISYLPGPIKGLFYYLHFIMDLYSRKIVGYEIYESESSENLAAVLKRATLNEGGRAPEILHSDNGSPMKGTTLVALCHVLGIGSSYSRPRTSNDNAHMESMFRTVKYCASYPYDGFSSLLAARIWIEGFVKFYNEEHHHSGLNFVTPNQKHNGEDVGILAKRAQVYAQAKAKNPKRWIKGNTRNWDPVVATSLVPTNPDSPTPKSSTTQQGSDLGSTS
jgi:Transposase and inactivated derivatives